MHAPSAMFGSGKAAAAPLLSPPPPTITSTFSTFLRNTWNAWDVRVIVLLSLLLQIALFVLGKGRKRNVSIVDRMILWFAYQTKDWVTIAALGKLSNSHAESPTSNVLRALWAPLLILYLGGPDTITAFSFQDTQLWSRHLLTFVAQSSLAFYVIYLSWTQFWLSLLTLPLSIAGVIKYVERIWCLKFTYTNKTQWIIPVFKNLERQLSEEKQESKVVLLGYAVFSTIRPDVNDFLCHREFYPTFKRKMQVYLSEAAEGGSSSSQVKFTLPEYLVKVESGKQSNCHLTHFNVAVVGLGFIFDVIYTKAALIYTKKGCFFRLISFTCSFVVLLLFLIRIPFLKS
ncbi:hypothetical protein SLEP1_g38573 [Rubroshorea leprosula]|nr:hypothetical protein SLEP1_g38573 [Rubroshorea leprosula]